MEYAQRGNQIQKWITYFVGMVVDSQEYSQKLIEFTVEKSKFFNRFRDKFNVEQSKVIKRIFQEGVDGFQGGMTAEKYMRISKVSKATATRHLQQLLAMGALRQEGQGRLTRYYLNLGV